MKSKYALLLLITLLCLLYFGLSTGCNDPARVQRKQDDALIRQVQRVLPNGAADVQRMVGLDRTKKQQFSFTLPAPDGSRRTYLGTVDTSSADVVLIKYVLVN